MLADPIEPLPPTSQQVDRAAFRSGERSDGLRDVPEETPVALSYDGSTHAVMMATPHDLEDFGVGFSLTERIVERATDIETMAVVPTDGGIDIQMWLSKPRADALSARHRYLAGPTGCGLCGVDSLTEALRPAPAVSDGLRVDEAAIMLAMSSLPSQQSLNRQTGAVHAAGFWRSVDGLIALREDVGRHNALDKLVGALARRGRNGAGGVLLLTSRVSVEMVQKAAVLGAEIMVAVSAPTALAIRTAEAAGITLVAVARRDGFEVFTHPHRIKARLRPVSDSTDEGHRPDRAAGNTSRKPPLISSDEALAIVLDGVVPIGGTEAVAIPAVVGRVAAETIETPYALPRFDHSAMDGYGIHGDDCGRTPPFRLNVTGRVLAGETPSCAPAPGETVRLMTGAAVPQGIAAVIMEEHCEIIGTVAEIRRAATHGMNIRLRGEDAEAGAILASAGTELGLTHVPVLAACGFKAVTVRRRLRVTILSTGNELDEHGVQPDEPRIHDANRAMLKAVFALPWIEVLDHGIVRDDPALLAGALANAANAADLVLASGGVSGSDADHMLDAVIAAGGRARALRVAVKPGKPLLIGAIGDVPVLGLPGSPVAALADMLIFGRPLARRRAGSPDIADDRMAVLAAPFACEARRTQVVPASVVGSDRSGLPVVALSLARGSARLYPLASASGLAVVPPSSEPLRAGDLVRFLPLTT